MALTAFGAIHADDSVRAVVEVRNVTTTSSDENDVPGSQDDMLFVRFDALLRNTTHRDMHVASGPVLLNKAERLADSGKWETLLVPSNIGTGSENLLSCSSVRKGEKFVFPSVSTFIVLAKKDKLAHPRVTVRFHLYNVCIDGSKRASEDFVSQPVEIAHR